MRIVTSRNVLKLNYNSVLLIKCRSCKYAIIFYQANAGDNNNALNFEKVFCENDAMFSINIPCRERVTVRLFVYFEEK